MAYAFIGYVLFILGVLSVCYIAYRYAVPLEKWLKIRLANNQHRGDRHE